ncbi:MAG TPA: AMP-binding protein, partial [Planctomycetota bacterium]|nr:AMP-binding protein [Planctomycetota bacterium]
MSHSIYLERGLKDPDHPRIHGDREPWTYGDLASGVSSVAGRLGPLEGARVGLFLDRAPESAALLLGTWQAGGVAVPFSLRGTAREHAYQVEDAGISRIILPSAHEGWAREILALSGPRGHSPQVIGQDELLREAPAEPAAPGRLRLDDPAVLLYTSGTTGSPKGVVHTHESLIHQVEVLRNAWEWDSTDRLLHVLPLHHVHGLVNGLLGALWAGAKIRFLGRFDPVQAWRELSGGRVTVFYAVPTLYHQLIEAWEGADSVAREAWARGAGGLRLVVSGSAALPTPLWARWREITGQAILERYGMTEIGMALSNPYRGERRPGTVGQPLPGMEVRIVDDRGLPAAEGTVGEIQVRGASLFQEYWNRPEATRESFRDGFFLTGDMAEWDRGYVR